ncbi:hypothetical protein BDP27DRAFT_1326323 [Rhodocollybia butyracea]|uniref:F-box domain-containing protein n=1 Tax=Rhodocollybia butyracea TaxID=206335 RepID=A0A9P5PVM7_9AGAR|nr:hypothetical protein BDP27DRAFT_1326323 [Rhodocollybia butyracea]
MHFTLLDRFRSKLRHKGFKMSNKLRQYQAHMQRSSEDSNDSEVTDISAKTSLDTIASFASVSTFPSVHSLLPPLNPVDLLRTNEQPSSQEAVEIHALLNSKRQKLSDLERRKQVLDRQRELLDRQRLLLNDELDEMSDTIDIYRGVVGCSMRQIPSDLLLEIFHHYVADSGNGETLTHVCRTWRQVALSSPSLWTTFSAPYVTKQSVSDVLRRVDRVKAATGLPLRFTLNLRKKFPQLPDAEFEQLSLDLVYASITQIHRWRSFSLHFEDSLHSWAGLPDISESMTASRMETLELGYSTSSFIQNPELFPVQWALSLIRSAPVLEDLRLKLPGVADEALSTLSLPHLEFLTIELPTITSATLLSLLRNAAPSLKVCKIYVAGLLHFDVDDDDFSALSMVEHSALETFELHTSHGASGEALIQLFDNLTLPAMREVLLEIGQFADNNHSAEMVSGELPEDLDLSWPHDSFLGFLERASSSVTSLRLGFISPLWDGMGSVGADLEEEHVQGYLDLPNITKSLVTLHVRRDRPVWPGLLEYITLPVRDSSDRLSSVIHRRSSLRSVKSRSTLNGESSSRLATLENVALDIDPIFQVMPMRDFVRSRWCDSSADNFSRLKRFSVTLCFPDIPNLQLESTAVQKVFERISGSEKGGAEKLQVEFDRRTYPMMPMDVPLVSLSELTI